MQIKRIRKNFGGKMDKIIITSLQEYIKYISESTHNDFYFRGESNYFHDRISSGLRNIECFDFGQAEKHRVPFFNYIKEFYLFLTTSWNSY